jgi:hypothetical protein
MKTRNTLFSAAILLALLLSACGGTGGASLTDGIAFHSIDEIIEQPLEVTSFANDGSASLPIHTTVPVACTIVYGTTPEFGSLSLDQDMAGGAHSDHNPVLSGLEPETTYYFRVQGVDESGVIYLSEVMTFTTPARESVDVTNLASPRLGAEIVGYSSAFGNAAPDATWGAASAFDDNPNTAWSSAGDGSNAWIEVKLAKPARITAVSFYTRSMSDGSAITLAFTVTTESGEEFGPFVVTDASQPYEFEVAFEAQTLRFDLVDTTGGNTGVVDIAVYGEITE